ncbi:MAG: TetR family transcriptional regulator, partial [Alphaproteobacteria bacterium]
MAESPGPPKLVRRAQIKANTRIRLLDATIDVIAAKGFADTTLAEVGRRAGMSRGIVNFHFASKERLMVATLRHLADEYALRLEKALGRAGPDPARRLGAMIAIEFHPRLCTRRKILTWRAFWA